MKGTRISAGVAAASALMLGVVAPARSQPPADTVVTTVPEVEVRALRGRDRLRDLPAAGFVLPAADLVRGTSGRISTALGALPGLFAYGSSGSGEPRTVDPRGFTANGESSYLKLLVDGRDVRGVEHGEVDWDWLPAGGVERVEVVQGPGAWLYGDGSEGGVVNVVTREAADGLAARGVVRGGSFGLRSGVLAGSARGDALAVTARGSSRAADGFRDHAEEEVHSVGGTLAGALGPVRLGLDAAWLDARHEEPGALTRDQLRADREQADTPGDFQHAKRLLVGGHVAWSRGAADEWRVAPYVRREKVEQVRTIFFVPLAHPTAATTVGTELTWRREGTAVALQAGLQTEYSRLESAYRDAETGARVALSESERYVLAAFTSARFGLGEHASARLGLRGDLVTVIPLDESPHDRTFEAVSPFLALSRTIGTAGSVWTSVSTAFRAPTLNQLYDARPFFVPDVGRITISNAKLDPQRAVNVEVGARHDGAAHRLLVTVYSSWVEDEIDFDLGTFSYANLGESWHRGVELAASRALGRGLWLEANGAWTPTTIEGGEDDGNQINAVPLGTAFGAVRWAPSPDYDAFAGVRWVGPQWLDTANDHELPDFAAVEIGGSLRLGRARVILRVANLLDRAYEESGFIGAIGEERFLPAPGRHASVAVTFD
jgi:outer membrane receptor protein involved in Fe transport